MNTPTSRGEFSEPSVRPEGQPLLSSEPLIHIGLRKGGNNWLREKVFASDATDFWVPGDSALPMEKIGSQPQAFIDRICSVSGIPTPEYLPFDRKNNARTAYLPSVFLRGIVPRSLDGRMKQRLERQIEEITGDTFVASNQETETPIGMGLGDFGYCT